MIIETVTTFARHIYNDLAPPAFDLAGAKPSIVATLVDGIVTGSKRAGRRT